MCFLRGFPERAGLPPKHPVSDRMPGQ